MVNEMAHNWIQHHGLYFIILMALLQCRHEYIVVYLYSLKEEEMEKKD